MITVTEIFWGAMAVLGGLGVSGIVAELRRRGRAAIIREETERDQSAQAPEDGAALEDDHYPARPPVPGQGSAGAAQSGEGGSGGGGTEGGISGQPADYGPPAPGGLGAALAEATGGETLQEEIDRLEARLAALYELQIAQIDDDTAAVEDYLATEALARAEWLEAPGRWCPCPNLAGDCDGWHTFAIPGAGRTLLSPDMLRALALASLEVHHV